MCAQQLLVPLGAALFLLRLICSSSAAPYPWQEQQLGYDASLDPIVWSRAFVQDAVRKPRHFKSLDLERNLVNDDENAYKELYRRLKASGFKPGNGFDAAHRNFGKRGRKYANYSWHDAASSIPAHFYRKSDAMLRKFLRRKHKLDERQRYALFERKHAKL